MSDNPKISFLIAADDHPSPTDRTVGSLIAQTLAPSDYECVIIGSSPTPDYLEAIAQAQQHKPKGLRLHYETIKNPTRAGAFNHGLPLCRAPLILFFADDFIAGPRTAEAHLNFHKSAADRRQVGVGTALIGPQWRTHFSAWLERSGMLFGVPFHDSMTSVPSNFFYIGNTSIRRDFLHEAGPFDEDYRYHMGDDYELGLRLARLGMVATYIPEARAEHGHHISLRERCQTMYKAGQTAAVFDRKNEQKQGVHVKCAVPPWRYRVNALQSRLRFSLHGRDDDLTAYYGARLDAAFVAGYRQTNGPIASGAAAR